MRALYISQLPLHPRSRAVRRDIESPYEMHRTLSRAFGDSWQDARCLFRVDEVRSILMVLVQSRVEPDWTALPGDYLQGAARISPAWKPVFRVGQRFAFRLRANPTVAREGHRHPLRTERERLEWIARKAEMGGFALPLYEGTDGAYCPRVTLTTEETVQTATRSGHGVILNAVRYDGILTVTAPVPFLETLSGGVGSAKGFGFGLLSLAPA